VSDFDEWWDDDNNTLIKNPSICTHYDIAEAAWTHQQAKLDTKELMIELMTKQAIDLNQTLLAKLDAKDAELEDLWQAVEGVVNQNLHLADGEVCTLRLLTKVIEKYRCQLTSQY
jgi:hypothetical protein